MRSTGYPLDSPRRSWRGKVERGPRAPQGRWQSDLVSQGDPKLRSFTGAAVHWAVVSMLLPDSSALFDEKNPRVPAGIVTNLKMRRDESSLDAARLSACAPVRARPSGRDLNEVQPIQKTRGRLRKGLKQRFAGIWTGAGIWSGVLIGIRDCRSAGSEEVRNLILRRKPDYLSDVGTTKKARIAQKPVRINREWRGGWLLHRKK
jgi:hypothetical protein